MKDVWDWFLKVLSHERYKAAGVVITLLFWGWLIGCEPKATFQGEDLSAKGLERAAITLRTEYEAAVEEMELAFADIEEEEAFRAKMLEFFSGAVGSAVSGNPINWAESLMSLLGIAAFVVGGGAVADKNRGNKVIAKLKAK